MKLKPVTLLMAALIGSVSLTACATNDYDYRGNRPGYSKRVDDSRYGKGNTHNRGDRYDRDVRKGGQAGKGPGAKSGRRKMTDKDVIYRDRNGRYYCKKDDGTTGTIVGAIGGGVLGNVIAPGGSKTLGTILGAGVGALAGRAIDRGDIHCE